MALGHRCVSFSNTLTHGMTSRKFVVIAKKFLVLNCRKFAKSAKKIFVLLVGPLDIHIMERIGIVTKPLAFYFMPDDVAAIVYSLGLVERFLERSNGSDETRKIVEDVRNKIDVQLKIYKESSSYS